MPKRDSELNSKAGAGGVGQKALSTMKFSLITLRIEAENVRVDSEDEEHSGLFMTELHFSRELAKKETRAFLAWTSSFALEKKDRRFLFSRYRHLLMIHSTNPRILRGQTHYVNCTFVLYLIVRRHFH